jgi:hypothetical protein
MRLRTSVALFLAALSAAPSAKAAPTIVPASGLTLQRTVTLTGANPLHGLDVDNTNGNVYVAGGGGTNLWVLRTDSTFSQISGNNVGSFVGVLSDIRLGPDGLIYAVTSNAASGPIKRFTKAGAAQSDLGVLPGCGSNAAGLAFGFLGVFYASENNANLYAFDSTAPAPVAPSTLSTGWVDVDDIETAHNKVLFVQDGTGNNTTGQRSVIRVAHDGTRSTFATFTTGAFYAAAYDWGSGAYYIGDYTNGILYRLVDANNDGKALAADNEITQVGSGWAVNELANMSYGRSSQSSSVYSLYISNGGSIIYEISGLQPPMNNGDFGDLLDDDGDGFCEKGKDSNNDRDCLDANEASAVAFDCNDASKTSNTGAKEICDGADNNCDGQKDEGFNVGAPCSVGVGACQKSGLLRLQRRRLGLGLQRRRRPALDRGLRQRHRRGLRRQPQQRLRHRRRRRLQQRR